MSILLVKYGEHAPVPAFAPCEACRAETPDPIADHCHAHGWVRAALCRGCNTRMALVDRGITPRGDLTAALIAIAGRCPDCPYLSVGDLGPTGSLRSIHRDSPDVNLANRTVRIPDELHARVAQAAETDRRSLNSEILWLVEQGLDRHEGGSGVSSPV